MSGSERPGQNQLKDYRTKNEPAKGEEDERPTSPVDDSDGIVKSHLIDDEQTPPAKDKTDEPEAPKGSPHDDNRTKIADRFAKKRNADTSEFDGDLTNEANLYGKLAGKDAGTGDEADTTGKIEGEADVAEPSNKLSLKVNGKSRDMSIDEVAVLLDMSADEVRANPKQAIKIAQKDLAASERLEDAKRIQRERQTSAADDTGARPDPAEAHQPPKKTGQQSNDQPEPNGDISHEEAEKLIEELQLEDPKVAAPKLLAFVKNAAKQASSDVVQQNKGNEVLVADRNVLATGLKEFGEAHPEVIEKPALQSAMIPALDAEYREDLVKAIAAEGEMDEDEARALVETAPSDHVRNAHQARRINGDPNVRKVDKTFLDAAYTRLKSDLGLPAQHQPQTLASERQQRKERLPHQPARASVPPSTPQPAKAPLTRSSAVADMKRARGQKSSAS